MDPRYNTSDMAWWFLIPIATSFALVTPGEPNNDICYYYTRVNGRCSDPPNTCQCLLQNCGKQKFPNKFIIPTS